LAQVVTMSFKQQYQGKKRKKNWNQSNMLMNHKEHPRPTKKPKRSHTHSNSKKQPALQLDSSSNSRLWSTPLSCLSWLVSSNAAHDESQDFITNYWSSKPYLLKRRNAAYYSSKGIGIDISTVYKIIELNEGDFSFGQNVICKYYDKSTKVETTTNERGDLVSLDEIKQLFEDKENGATIQLLHPHFYHYEVAHLIFQLESYFGNFVSANIYVTPNQKQGLKAHWDDIDAFILQLHGKKKWKLYRHKEEQQRFPVNESVHDLDVNDAEKFEFIMECVLSPGDLLYFPRGIVHFAECVSSSALADNGGESGGDDYSLHLTISTNQNHHYGEVVKAMVSKYVDELVANDVDFRRNLPVNIIGLVGDKPNITQKMEAHTIAQQKRRKFEGKISELFDKVKTSVFGAGDEIDGVSRTLRAEIMRETVDEMAVQFTTHRYPPVQFLAPEQFAIFGDAANKKEKEEEIEPAMKAKDSLIEQVEDQQKRGTIINVQSEVRLVNPGWMRVVDVKQSADVAQKEDGNEQKVDAFLDDEDEDEDDDVSGNGVETEDEGKVLLYSCVRNEQRTHLMAYQEETASEPVMATERDKQVFEVLNEQYPDWIKVHKLNAKCDKVDAKRIRDLLFSLWADGLLQTKTHS